MNEFSDHLVIESSRRAAAARFRPIAFVVIPLAAVLFQVYVPLFFQYLSYLELPLLVTVYFALMGRRQIAGTLIGACIGLMQDSLSHQPLGMFGIVKSLVGYFAVSVSLRFESENPAVRMILALFFYLFHQFFYWVMVRALFGQQFPLSLQENLLVGALNALVAWPLYHLLDKLRDRG